MDKENALMTKAQEEVAEYGKVDTNLAGAIAEEMDGLNIIFDRIKIPAGGGIAYEIPGDDADNPDTVKEFKAVILYHHPVHQFYQDKYTGGNNPPDCGSMDGHYGIDAETGERIDCRECPNNRFGSGENGAKACKQKRRLYILRPGETLPVILSLPTGSLGEFSKFVMRQLSKGRKTNSIVTKFSLKKAQNNSGINYSQAVLTMDRLLNAEEIAAVEKMGEQVKAIAGRVAEPVDESIEE